MGASQLVLLVKKPPVNADRCQRQGLGSRPGGGHDSPAQYSCLETSMDRKDWQATVHGVAKSQLNDFYFHFFLFIKLPFCFVDYFLHCAKAF